mmetsp:Transcript_67874/g.209860  ORF Transcript_67874/g.209860 Transcript_67874/m.209860 type:complete len:258 (+) Transcript_67874:2226-2999(+)
MGGTFRARPGSGPRSSTWRGKKLRPRRQRRPRAERLARARRGKARTVERTEKGRARTARARARARRTRERAKARGGSLWTRRAPRRRRPRARAKARARPRASSARGRARARARARSPSRAGTRSSSCPWTPCPQALRHRECGRTLGPTACQRRTPPGSVTGPIVALRRRRLGPLSAGSAPWFLLTMWTPPRIWRPSLELPRRPPPPWVASPWKVRRSPRRRPRRCQRTSRELRRRKQRLWIHPGRCRLSRWRGARGS